MKNILIAFLATILLTSCQQKKAEADRLQDQTVFTAATQDKPMYEPPYDNNRTDKTPLAAEKEVDMPVTRSLAMLTTPQEEKDERGNIVIKNRVETKEPTQIIRNAMVNFQVENTDSSHEHIARSLSGFGAYFGSDRRAQNSAEIQQAMVIRVPAANFDKLMDVLMKESTYTNNKDITADDVTAEFVDIQIRLKSKKEVEKRYIELLSRAQKVPDILEVESNLRVVREEIESMEGRLKLLKDEVAYSTINLTITQKLKGEPVPEMNFGYRLRSAAVNGWRGLESFALGLVGAWPLLVFLTPLVIWVIIRRRRRAAKA